VWGSSTRPGSSSTQTARVCASPDDLGQQRAANVREHMAQPWEATRAEPSGRIHVASQEVARHASERPRCTRRLPERDDRTRAPTSRSDLQRRPGASAASELDLKSLVHDPYRVALDGLLSRPAQ
jgi:hypothetical protein